MRQAVARTQRASVVALTSAAAVIALRRGKADGTSPRVAAANRRSHGPRIGCLRAEASLLARWPERRTSGRRLRRTATAGVVGLKPKLPFTMGPNL